MEKDQCEVFDSYGLPLHWYEPSAFVTWVFKHYQDVSSNVGQLQATDFNTCGHYALLFLFMRAKGNNDHKMGERLRKLVTRNLFKLDQEENQQSVLRSVKKHVSWVYK